jgi:hypothetical protein
LPGNSGGGGSRSVDVFDLRTGDCFASGLSAGDAFGSVSVVACSSRDAEALVSVSFTVSRSGDLPSDAYFDLQAQQRCPLDADRYIFPTAESWEFGDRTMNCVETFP